jgi:hypothetical protein
MPQSRRPKATKAYWSDEWLQGLVDRYNRRYFGGRLCGWSVEWCGGRTGKLPAAAVLSRKRRQEFQEAFGPNWPAVLAKVNQASAGCDRLNRRITLHIEMHGSDREVGPRSCTKCAMPIPEASTEQPGRAR